MENASKALIIAGGILLAIITLSVLVYSYNHITIYQDEKEKNELQEQITKYNAEYEGYNKKVMYGADVISVLNKAISNIKIKEISLGNEYYVDVEFDIGDNSMNLPKGNYSIEKGNYEKITKNPEYFSAFKLEIFKCEKIEYNKSGRISKMVFKHIPKKDKYQQ